MRELGPDRRGTLAPRCWVVVAWAGCTLSQLWQVSEDQGLWLGKQNWSCVPELTPVPFLSPEPAFSDHLRLCQCPQLQPVPLPHRAQWLRGWAGQLPEGAEL